MRMTIGIIGEGVTDHTAIRQILRSFTEDENLLVSSLQPGALRAQGGWPRVLKYCRSQRFKQAFTATEFKAVVQIDTDWLLQDGNRARYEIPDAHKLSTAELVTAVRALLIREMDASFYEQVASRIMFAISVHQIECWLLGIFCDTEVASQTDNCEDLLHNEASKRGIQSRNKSPHDFETICAAFAKGSDLEKHSRHNPSFHLFLEELRTKLPTQP